MIIIVTLTLSFIVAYCLALGIHVRNIITGQDRDALGTYPRRHSSRGI